MRGAPRMRVTRHFCKAFAMARIWDTRAGSQVRCCTLLTMETAGVGTGALCRGCRLALGAINGSHPRLDVSHHADRVCRVVVAHRTKARRNAKVFPT
jgi:hypothetical protein